MGELCHKYKISNKYISKIFTHLDSNVLQNVGFY